MPNYTYICTNCSHTDDQICPIDDRRSAIVCTRCGGISQYREVPTSPPAFHKPNRSYFEQVPSDDLKPQIQPQGITGFLVDGPDAVLQRNKLIGPGKIGVKLTPAAVGAQIIDNEFRDFQQDIHADFGTHSKPK